ncbi:MAG: hypothetical protein HWQ38_00735 [Nostoc sp. NMS7]|uniref:hypothetical protein n=1 Tax=Nostoc sp. NMS7 TaxID=2815391 RepID=UPI0025EDD2FE|nr:hypothetical protein [Nostoc sp. NMS7]MBN3945084.1 hypothetical protein [Nostoc sp. NMS7]
MSSPKSPRPLTTLQLKRLKAYIYAEPILDLQEFVATWDLNRQLIAQVCRVDLRTVNTWFSQGRTHQNPQTYHLWYLTTADIILQQYEYLPEFLQALLCTLDDY